METRPDIDRALRLLKRESIDPELLGVWTRINEILSRFEDQDRARVRQIIRYYRLETETLAKVFFPSKLLERYEPVCVTAVKALINRLINKNERDQWQALSRQAQKSPGLKIALPEIVFKRTTPMDPPWQVGEREYLFVVVEDPEFWHSRPQYARCPDYLLIENEINKKFHGGKRVRTAARLSVVVRYDRFARRQKLPKSGGRYD